MKIEKDKLQEALTKVKPALASREMIEQSTSFAFMGDRVVTYNDEISISHPVEGLDITGAVTAKALYDFLGKVKRKEIDIECDEDQVKIVAGKSKAGLVFEREIKLPVEAVGKIGKWKSLPTDFITALKFCHPCCSKDMSRPVLTCVHVNGASVQGSDGYQIAVYNVLDEVAGLQFLIPSSSVRELIKYDVKSIAKGEGWIHFKTEDDTIFSSRIFDGEFPDVSPHLKVKGVKVEFPKQIVPILERARVFANGGMAQDMPMALVEIEEGKVKVSSKDESGWFEEEANIKYEGDPIKFSANVEFLINVLNRVQACVVSKSAIRFAGENWTHVVAMQSED
jgi:DNA polymerase III sliding clamp (beta) subunit (PCNA family)